MSSQANGKTSSCAISAVRQNALEVQPLIHVDARLRADVAPWRALIDDLHARRPLVRHYHSMCWHQSRWGFAMPSKALHAGEPAFAWPKATQTWSSDLGNVRHNLLGLIMHSKQGNALGRRRRAQKQRHWHSFVPWPAGKWADWQPVPALCGGPTAESE